MLAVLFFVNVLNFADRTIISVLTDLIKHDLGVTDAQIGFLVGTSFVILSSITGLAMGSIVDLWLRNRLLALALALWSGLTAVSGFASHFSLLAAARFGVGVGEAVGTPVSHSLLADYFPPRGRARAFALFFCAPSIGMAISLSVSGWIAQTWPEKCAGLGLCHIASWQAPFFVFGLPGLLFAVLAWMIRDPASGASIIARQTSRPLAEAMREIVLLIPPFPCFALWRIGGSTALAVNLALGGGIVIVAGLLVAWTGDTAQWLGVGFAFYAFASWCQSLRYRDPALYRLTIASPVMSSFLLGCTVNGTVSGAIGFWSVPYAIRTLGIDHKTAGAVLGIAIAVGAILGTLLGGFSSDRWRRTNPAAPLWVAMLSMILSTVMVLVMLMARDITFYAFALGAFLVAVTMWAPPIASLVQELVVPRMRGRAAAIYATTLTLIPMSLGTYVVGKVADVSGSLKIGMLAPFLGLPVCIILLLFAIRHLPDGHAARQRIEAAEA